MFADKSFLTGDFIVKASSDSIGFVTLMRQSASEAIVGRPIPEVPTLVLWGEADRFTKFSMGKNLAMAMANGEFKLLINAGHMPQIEQPDAFIKEVTAFLSG
jgi:pimeloyl-ACP methyl ester carboxylesterase